MKKYFLFTVVITIVLGCAICLAAQTPPAPSPKMAAAGQLYQQQKWQEAIKALGEVTKEEPKNGRAWYMLGRSYHSLGNYTQAIEAFQQNVAIAQNPNSMYNIACGYARLKQPDKAFEWLEKAIAGGVAPVVSIETDADLEGIRADARFKKMLDLADRSKRPCMYQAEARQLDFWIGDWDVFNTAGQKVGTNLIQSFADGCALMENWTATVGGNGKSINYYDASTSTWYQHWIGSGGGALRYAGKYIDGAMRFEGETVASGKKTLHRLTFSRLDEGAVRQFAETSADDGKTWAVSYDFKYVKRK